MDQTACKPGSVEGPQSEDRRPVTVIPLDRPLLDGSRDLPGHLGPASPAACAARCPYSVLLQAGLAMRSVSPRPRWALTPPFHPYRRAEAFGRFAFCGAIPRVAPGGRYPPPFRRGARTFLDEPKPAATARPSDPGAMWGRLTIFANSWAASATPPAPKNSVILGR